MGHFTIAHRLSVGGGGGMTEGAAVSGGTPNSYLGVDASGNLDSLAHATFLLDQIGYSQLAKFERNDNARKSLVSLSNPGSGGAQIELYGAGGDKWISFLRNFGQGYAVGIDESATGRPLCVSPNAGGGEGPVPGTSDITRFYQATQSQEIVGGFGFLPITISNAAHTITAIQPLVRFVSLSATRVATLPPANALRAGQVIVVTVDATGAAGVFVDITRAGADTIGAGTTYPLNSPFETVILMSDGVSVWQAIAAN